MAVRFVVFDREANVDACQPDDPSVQLRDDEAIRFARHQKIHAVGDGVRRGRIAELLNEPCQGLCIFRMRISNR